MNKKKHLAIFLLAVFGLATVFSLTVSAQNPNLQRVNSDKVLLNNYVTGLSLPNDQRPGLFSSLSNEDKANLMRFHLAFQMLKRPWLNQGQKDLILESISMIASESYDKTNPQIVASNQRNADLIQQKAARLFPKPEGAEIFASFSGNSTDANVLQRFSEATASIYSGNRRDAFSKLSPADKSNTMKIHLLKHLARYELSLDQRRFILSSVDFVKPEVYAYRQGSPERASIEAMDKSFRSQAVSLFSPREAAEIFASLGGIRGQGPERFALSNLKGKFGDITDLLQSPCAGSQSNQVNSVTFGKINFSPNYEAPVCSCNGASDWCGTWYGDKYSCRGIQCEFKANGCGTWLNYACAGLCGNGGGSELEFQDN